MPEGLRMLFHWFGIHSNMYSMSARWMIPCEWSYPWWRHFYSIQDTVPAKFLHFKNSMKIVKIFGSLSHYSFLFGSYDLHDSLVHNQCYRTRRAARKPTQPTRACKRARTGSNSGLNASMLSHDDRAFLSQRMNAMRGQPGNKNIMSY